MQHKEEYVYNAHKGWQLVQEQGYISQSKIGHINSPVEKTRNKLNYSPDFDENIKIQKDGGPRVKKDYTPLSKDTPNDAVYVAYTSLKNFRDEVENRPINRDLSTIMRVTAMINTFIRENFNNKYQGKNPSTIPAALKNLYNSFRELTVILSEIGDSGQSGSLFRSIAALMNSHIQSTKAIRHSTK
jgi:hypothetical protein